VTQREVLFTGVGGQGVQIVSKALAMAALAEGRNVLLLPSYGGGMRGGMTNAGLTVSDGALHALPVITSAWSAFVMDPAYWETVRPNLADGAITVVNSSVFHLSVDVPGARVYAVPAMDMAVQLGSPMSAGFVMLGAFACITGLVRVDSAVDAMRQLVPAYRSQHVAANEQAIRAGADSVSAPESAAPAWPDRAGV
jgi:2-oxoglutarate ferredoxin oxidoreductase subunit gamma